LWAAGLFLAIGLAMAVLALLSVAGEGPRDWSQPLWLRFARFLARAGQAMNRPGAAAAELVLLPAAAAWAAWAACRRLLPGRFLECAVGGLVYGFAPCLLTLLAHGVAREAFGHALLPFLLVALLRHAESGRPAAGWLAAGLFALIVLAARATVPAAVLVGIAAWFHGRRLALETGRPPLSLAWFAPGTAALLVFLADPFGGWLLDAYPSVAALPDPLTLPRRAASLVVLRSSLGPGGLDWTAHTAYLGKVVLLLAILALAIPEPAWRPWKAGWAAALALFLGWYLLPGWWLGLALPAASTVVRAGPWSFMPAVMLLAALLAALALARILDGLAARGRPRTALLLAVGWWLLVDAAQAVPRGWSELRGPAGRDEPEPAPPARPPEGHAR
jgi:hypothetical protein